MIHQTKKFKMLLAENNVPGGGDSGLLVLVTTGPTAGSALSTIPAGAAASPTAVSEESN